MTHLNSSGGWIYGETKLVVTLRILAGGDACNLGVIFDISPKHCNTVILYIIRNWINKMQIGGINIYKYLKDDMAMDRVD